MLQLLFSSKVRVKILEYFFFHPGEEFYVRHLATLLNERVGTIGRELNHLEKSGILRSRMVGNQKHYALCKECSIYEDLRNIFLKTTGASKELKSALNELPTIELAFLYGSYAKGEAGLTSDLDLMIVGEPEAKQLATIVSKIERKLKREINYTVYTRSEIESRIGIIGDFLNEVFSGPRIFLIGSENDKLFRLTQ